MELEPNPEIRRKLGQRWSRTGRLGRYFSIFLEQDKETITEALNSLPQNVGQVKLHEAKRPKNSVRRD